MTTTTQGQAPTDTNTASGAADLSLQKRVIFDAIRGAYDLGYRDARNAHSTPGDYAPGYKGRQVEADHGGALSARIAALASAPAQTISKDERALRRLLCAKYEHLPYMDDGEAQGQTLDWLRGSVEEIETRIREINIESFAAQPDTHPTTGEEMGTDAQEATAWRLTVENLERENAELRKGLELAIKQNSHDMLMTGEELRKCEAALAAHTPDRQQALRLLTQKERDSLGHRAEGMDGNEWDQWVQEKFAQVNGLKIQGGSYEWDWE